MTRARSPLRAWVTLDSSRFYTAACPACGLWSPRWTRDAAIRQADFHSRRCPALRLARLEAELDRLVEHWMLRGSGMSSNQELVSILDRHRQATR